MSDKEKKESKKEVSKRKDDGVKEVNKDNSKVNIEKKEKVKTTEEKPTQNENKKSKSKTKMIVIISVIILSLLIFSIGGFGLWFFLDRDAQVQYLGNQLSGYEQQLTNLKLAGDSRRIRK